MRYKDKMLYDYHKVEVDLPIDMIEELRNLAKEKKMFFYEFINCILKKQIKKIKNKNYENK